MAGQGLGCGVGPGKTAVRQPTLGLGTLWHSLAWNAGVPSSLRSSLSPGVVLTPCDGKRIWGLNPKAVRRASSGRPTSVPFLVDPPLIKTGQLNGRWVPSTRP